MLNCHPTGVAANLLIKGLYYVLVALICYRFSLHTICQQVLQTDFSAHVLGKSDADLFPIEYTFAPGHLQQFLRVSADGRLPQSVTRCDFVGFLSSLLHYYHVFYTQPMNLNSNISLRGEVVGLFNKLLSE